MKLTRQRLKQLIIEAINEAKYYIGDSEGNVQSAIDAFHGGYTKDAVLGSIARPGRDNESNARAMKAVKMIRSKDLETREQGRELARTIVDFGMVDEDILQDLKDSLSFTSDGSLELTDIEKTARDHMPDDKVDLDRDRSEQPRTLIDKGALLGAMKSKSDGILSHFGFKYVEDQPGPSHDYSDHGPKFRFQAKVLGCDVQDLAYCDLDYSFPEDDDRDVYNAILEIMREMKPQEIPIPEDVGDFGQNNLYDLGGVRVLLTGDFGYYTITICGQ